MYGIPASVNDVNERLNTTVPTMDRTTIQTKEQLVQNQAPKDLIVLRITLPSALFLNTQVAARRIIQAPTATPSVFPTLGFAPPASQSVPAGAKPRILICCVSYQLGLESRVKSAVVVVGFGSA